MDYRCCDPLHTTRNHDLGWDDRVLGSVTGKPVAVLCDACARAQALEPPRKDPTQAKLDEIEARLAAAESKLATVGTVPK